MNVWGVRISIQHWSSTAYDRRDANGAIPLEKDRYRRRGVRCLRRSQKTASTSTQHLNEMLPFWWDFKNGTPASEAFRLIRVGKDAHILKGIHVVFTWCESVTEKAISILLLLFRYCIQSISQHYTSCFLWKKWSIL